MGKGGNSTGAEGEWKEERKGGGVGSNVLPVAMELLCTCVKIS